MATASNISPMPQFQPKSDPTNTGAKWTGWLEKLETYLIAADVTNDARKPALLLYQAGPEVYEVFKTLPDTGKSNNYTKAKDALTKHFKPAKNPIFEIFNFRQAKQRADETLDGFHKRLPQAVIPKLDGIFATHGIPVKLTSDNGPPFNGTEFERYMKALNIDWKTSNPLWPQGNANVENLNKTLSKVLHKAKLEERNWRQELQRFLLSYRATPHTTKIAPCELLYNRKIRGFLPELPTKRVINKHREAKENIARGKASNKKYYDIRHHAKKSNIKEGDIVICLQKKSNKLTSKFSPE
eukprot:gene11067-19928_t